MSALAAGASVALFLVLWVLLLKGTWAAFPLGRALSTVLMGSLYVALALLPPARAFAAVSLPTLALLAGCMLLSAHAERQGLYRALSALLLSGSGGRVRFLARVSLFSAASSALITNDAACILLPPLVLAACRARGYSAPPYLIAVATAANLGSACSCIGNPQNMIIAAASGMTFRAFLAAIGLASALGLVVNGAIIVAVWKDEFLGQGVGEGGATAAAAAATAAADAATAAAAAATAAGSAAGAASMQEEPLRLLSHAADPSSTGAGAAAHSTSISLEDTIPEESECTFTSVVVTPPTSPARGSAPQQPQPAPPSSDPQAQAQPLSQAEQGPTLPLHLQQPRPEPPLPPPNRAVQAVLALLPLALLLSDLWMGLPWTVLFFGALCCALERVDPDPVLSRVDAKLLLFFSGLFVCVEGLSESGLPKALLEGVVGGGSGGAGSASHSLLAFSATVLVGSNTVSNVPLVLLLAPMLPVGSSLWLVLAWVSTVAGNFTLLGSVANIIVAEVAAKEGVELSFLTFAKVGIPSTLLSLALFTPLVNAIAVRL